jgi:hypothetical protein
LISHDLTRLTKQVVFGLTYNGSASQASRPKPDSPTRIVNPTHESCMDRINLMVDFQNKKIKEYKKTFLVSYKE